MLFCVALGSIAHLQSTNPTCPHHAFAFAGSDGKVGRYPLVYCITS